ncbi:MAG: LamG domain-containing protein [Syntrophales bacterium]|jgi:hypothetical protein|nr:LamG domain-containing protein [Syntrophales bacterium]MCK9390258.1 LamG domain-containing protein [Syntrophales bacterium]
MYHIPIATHNRIVRGEIPILYLKIATHLGDRVYAKKTITVAAIAGSLGCLPRVLDFGTFERTLGPKKDNLLASYTRKQQQHISVALDNADKYFSILLGKEPFLSRPISIWIGFEDEPVANHISIFQGKISEVSALSVLSIEADEKSSNSPSGVTLDDTYYLHRAGKYANPLNTADLLPIVYGDCSDGDEGVWTLPCIDIVNHVYCFSDSPVLGTGNAINIYSAGILVDPANYTFNPSHDFEPPVPPPALHVQNMNIATVTFTADQGTNVITAKGKGKVFLPVTLAGGTMIANIVDMVDDLLTEENDFTSAIFEASKKAQASQIFDKWGYVAGGVISQDGTLWEIITAMMSSVLGSAYLNGAGQLVLEIDDGTIDQYSAGTPPTLPKQETTLIESNLRLVNVINQCPANYGYNYAAEEFRHETDDTAHADGISQGIYGIRKPGTPYQHYWCRDLTTVQLIQDTIVGKFNSPLYEIEVEDITLKRMHLDVGDAVIYSADALYDQESNALIDNIWRVISVAPDFASGKITFRLLQIFYRSAIPHVAPTPWDGILRLTVPDVPMISVSASVIEETPVEHAPVALTVPAVPTLAVSTLVHNSRECTISIDEPGLVTCAGHGMANGDMCFFKTTGALPTGLTPGDWLTGGKYYVRNKTTDDFNLSLTAGGALIDTSGSQSGVHRCFGVADDVTNYTVSLLHFNGEADGTVFTDESEKIWTPYGTPLTRQAEKKFGNAAGFFDGNSGIYTPNHADLNFGSGDFTVEFWAYANNVGPWPSGGWLFGKCATAAASPIAIVEPYNDGLNLKLYMAETTAWDLVNGAIIGNLGMWAWGHVAICRSGPNVYAFLNGVLGSTTDIGTAALLAEDTPTRIGHTSGAGSGFAGIIDDLRITKGIARYTSDFSASLQSAEYPYPDA